MEHQAICKNKAMALDILETIINGTDDGMIKTALQAVSQWVKTTAREDITKMTREERDERLKELMRLERSRMTDDERRARAAFWLPEKDIPFLTSVAKSNTI